MRTTSAAIGRDVLAALTSCKLLLINFTHAHVARELQMMRRERRELEQKLAQIRRLAQEPTDPFTRERLAQLIEDLELQLEAGRVAA
jgi:chromosomal replication initiation ATPase DnaA